MSFLPANVTTRLFVFCAGPSTTLVAMCWAMSAGILSPRHASGQATSFGQYSVGDAVGFVAAGDLNRDRLPDFAATQLNTNKVSVFINQGGGRFLRTVDLLTPSEPRAVAIADLDGAHGDDLVVCGFQSHNLRVYFNDATSSFADSGPLQTKFNPASVVAVDLDNDGDRDIAVSNSGSNNVTVYRNDGARNFVELGPFHAGTSPVFLVAADFDGDGDTDLATALHVHQLGCGCGYVSVLRNQLDQGGFAFPMDDPVVTPTGPGPRGLAVAQLMGDALPELVVACQTAADVRVLHNIGGGRFAPLPAFGATEPQFAVAIADVGGDGQPDLITANYDVNKGISVLKGVGGGSFGPRERVPVGDYPRSIAVADFNRDGRLDFAVANEGSGSVSVLLSQGGGANAACLYDSNGDGVVNTPDLVSFLGQFGQPCP